MKIFRAVDAASIFFAAVILLASPVSAANISVNDGSSALPGSLDSAYAVGGSGVAEKVSGSWALTARGLEEVTGDNSALPTIPPVPPSPVPISGTVNVTSNIIKVGLKYYYSNTRDSSVESAAVVNSVGSGFRFGYYDANRSFVEVGSTEEKAITMIKDTNVTVPAGVVGCYHIKLPGAYTSFSAASSAAAIYQDGFPAYYNGVYNVLVGEYTSSALAAAAASSRGINGTAFSASSRCVVVTKTGSTKILFEFDYGDAYCLGILPVSIPEKAVTTCLGVNYYGGFEFRRIDGGGLTVINVVDIEDYTVCVVATEMSYSWPLEALKAQAVAARTYASRYIKNSVYYDIGGYDVTNDTYTQAYSGTGRLGGYINDAIEQTRGLYAVYAGKLIIAFYFSSDGGSTEDNANVNGTEIAYLKGVIDPYEAAAADINTRSSWSVTMTPAALGEKLGLGVVISAEGTYSNTGNCIQISFKDAAGKTKTLVRDACRTTLGLNSIHYAVTRNADGSFLFEGGGWGHNIGMSQYGAYAMANTYGFDFRQILGFYYTGINLATGV